MFNAIDMLINERKIDFKPIGKRVIIKRKHADVGGLSLTPELERESHPDIGTIVQIGQIGWFNKYIRGIRVGKQVQFARFSPVKIALGEDEWIYVELVNILGVQSN